MSEMKLSKFQISVLDAMHWGSTLRLVRNKYNLLTDCRLADGTCVPLRTVVKLKEAGYLRVNADASRMLLTPAGRAERVKK